MTVESWSPFSGGGRRRCWDLIKEMDYNSRLRDLGLYSVYGRCDLLKLLKDIHAKVVVSFVCIFERHNR